MKNTIEDLNNHLFEMLERLNDDNLTDSELEKELKRADGMTKVAGQIIQNAELAYKTMKHLTEYGNTGTSNYMPVMLGVKNEN